MGSPDWELAGAVQRAVDRYFQGQNTGNVPPVQMARLATVINVYRGSLTREQAIAEANILAPAQEQRISLPPHRSSDNGNPSSWWQEGRESLDQE